MILLLSLLLAHFSADYYLQKHSWIMSKVKYHEKSLGLFYHILVHVGVTSIALFLATNEWNLVVTCAMIFIICTHYAIDIWKTYQTFITRYYIIDQAGHLSMIVIVSWLLNSYYPELLTQSHVLLCCRY